MSHLTVLKCICGMIDQPHMDHNKFDLVLLHYSLLSNQRNTCIIPLKRPFLRSITTREAVHAYRKMLCTSCVGSMLQFSSTCKDSEHWAAIWVTLHSTVKLAVHFLHSCIAATGWTSQNILLPGQIRALAKTRTLSLSVGGNCCCYKDYSSCYSSCQ